MATIVLGCDSNGNDKKCQDTVAKILEKAGHKIEKLSIGPNFFAKYSYGSKAKGKIGVYLMAASLVSVVDLYSGNTNFKYAYFGIRGDVSTLVKSVNDLNTKKIPKDHHGDCTTKLCDEWAGKTYAEINEITKSKCQVTAGSNNEELGNNLVKAMGGETDSSSSKKNSVSTIKEALCDVLYGWDGDAECFLRGDTVYIQKIKSPSTATLSLIEGDNIDLGSVNVTDVNPSTVNYLTCDFKDKILTIKDDFLIKRFGKISSTVTVDDSIKKLDDAKEFLLREWAKIKRDNGHKLECSVQGHSKWKNGWCYVYLPSFNIQDYMYIEKISQDDPDGNWTCNLTLVDYPPGFGKPTSINDSDKESST